MIKSVKVDVGKKEMTIIMAIDPVPSKSSPEKNILVASSGGYQMTDAKHDGKTIKVSVNAIVAK